MHSFSTVVCAITARFAVSQCTMNELQSRSFDCRIAAAADGVFVVVVVRLWRLCKFSWRVGVVVFPSTISALSAETAHESVCDRAQMRFIEISSECFRLHNASIRCDIFFVAFPLNNQFSAHKYFNLNYSSSAWHFSQIIKQNQIRLILSSTCQVHAAFDLFIITTRLSFLYLLLLFVCLLLLTRFSCSSPVPLCLIPCGTNFNSK